MKLPLHKLITPGENKHYDTEDEKTTIEQIEEKLTVEEMIGACKFNIFKYRSREKGSNEEDETKALKYEDYLSELLIIDPFWYNTKVSDTWKEHNIKWRYQ